jgi:hypothetical protein
MGFCDGGFTVASEITFLERRRKKILRKINHAFYILSVLCLATTSWIISALLFSAWTISKIPVLIYLSIASYGTVAFLIIIYAGSFDNKEEE